MSENAVSSDEKTVTQESLNSEKYLIFSILDKLYSFPSRIIGEIAIFDAVYPLPLVPAHVLGVVNRYSVPYALFDIGLLFYKTPCPKNKVLIVKEEIDHIAFLIDDVSDIADVHPENLKSVERTSASKDLTEAVSSSFNWNGKEVLVLDIYRLIGHVSGDSV